jgi:chromosome segregation ATPase
MAGADAEQFLDLIAENAQIKAEIMALRQFAGLVREFDSIVIGSCTQEVLGSRSDDEALGPLLTKIRQGIPPVESAESFKQRMVAERTKKICDAQRTKLSELQEKIAQAEQRKADLTTTTQSIQARVDEHRRILSESHAIRDNFAKQIELMQASIDSLTKQKEELSAEISRAQATGLEIRRNIEQAHRDLNDFSESGDRESQEMQAIRNIVSELRSQMKKPRE